jgi:uncharacterized protein
MRKILKVASVFIIFFVVSCVTVNIYFPSAEVQKAADKIVDDVRTKGTDAKPESAPVPAQGPSSRLDIPSSFSLGPTQAQAAMNIDISTPAIRAIKDSMRNRFPQLKPFYDRGAIGESNKGFLEARDTASLHLQERSLVNKLIDQENRDRAALYSEIASANKFGAELVPQVKQIFANSWREKSQTGWWVQDDNGTWKTK